MKTNTLIAITTVFLLLFTTVLSFGQGNSCNTATAFCSNGLDPYPAGVGVPAPPVGNNYGCLGTQPNPAWFYINVTQTGSLDFVLNNSNNLDIDFILYGPFPNLATAVGQCGGLGNGGISGGIADCSYSAVAVEPVSVANVVAGQVYVLLVTNYSNQPTNIFATANSGTGNYACDCRTDVTFGLAPAGFNDAVIIDTTETSIEFAVCSGDQVGFTIDVRADSIIDSIGIYLPATNIGNVFGPSNVTVFGPIYPIPGRYDTASFVIFINTNSSHVGINDAVLSILNSGCVQDLNIRVNVIGVRASSSVTSACAGIAQTSQLSTVTTAAAGGTYLWTQLSGVTAPLSSTTIANPIASIPAGTIAGDSIVYEVTFQSSPDSISGLACTAVDRVVIRFVNTPLAVDLTAPTGLLCQNGLPNNIPFNTSVSGPSGVNSTSGVYTWTAVPAAALSQLSATNIGNPVGQVTGTPGSNVRYIVQYAYGACVGRDTVRLDFGNWAADVTPATAAICAGDSVALTAAPGPSGCGSSYTITNIPYQSFSGTPVPANIFCDDCSTPQLPIGFSFQYYCTNYSNFRICSNGFISLDGLGTTGSNAWAPAAMPTAGVPNSIIALAWRDLATSTCGNITYFTAGTAPNRRLIVSFNGVCFLFAPASTLTGQIVLYETTNVIELHITNFSNSNATQGVENQNGTIGHPVPGRNNVTWSATNNAWRFTPTFLSFPTYSWSPTTNISATTAQTVTVNPTVNTTYQVSVSEGGCTMVDSAVITMTSAIGSPTVTCSNITNNSITFDWTTVASALSYEYSTDGITWFPAVGTTQTLTGLPGGANATIFVRAIGAAGPCNIGVPASQSCVIPCNDPSAFVTVSNNTICNASNAYIIVNSFSGGIAPIVFNLGGGLTDTAFVVGDTLFQGIAAGNYTAVLSEQGSTCLGTVPVSFTVTNTPPTVAATFTTTVNTICNGSNATVSAATISGATFPASFDLGGGQIDTANAAGDLIFSNLAAGNYTVAVTDLTTGCAGTSSFTVTDSLPTVAATFTTTVNTICNGSNATVSAATISGATFPASFDLGGQIDTANAAGDLIFSNLAAGNYTVAVTDLTTGCAGTSSFTVTDSLPTVAATFTTVGNSLCVGSDAMVTIDSVIGGNFPLQFQFNTNIIDTANAAGDVIFTGIGAGNFTMTVTDLNTGCTGTVLIPIPNLAPVVNATVDPTPNTFCVGSNASVTVLSLSGAAFPVSFNLGAGQNATANAVGDVIFSGIAAGNYTAVVTDPSNGCTGTVVISVPDSSKNVRINIQQTTEIPCGSNTGAALRVNVINGSPISYLWSNTETNDSISNLGVGTYHVAATDATGTCVDKDTLIITVPFVPTLNAWVGQLGQDSVCIFQGEPSVLNAGANETGVSYLWSPTTGVTTIDSFTTAVLGVNSGNIVYIVTATSLDGCETMDTVILCVNPSEFKGLPTAFSPNGQGANETFGPVGLVGATVSRFEIYNRWGQKVHDSSNGTPWDGTTGGAEQPRDVYLYIFEYQFPADPTPTTVRGTVTLLK